MAEITLKGTPIQTSGQLPAIESTAPGFKLTRTDLSDCGFEAFAGKTIVMNIFPSIDTPVCATSVRRFNQAASEVTNTVVLCISADLPFAHKRFCEAEGLKDVIPLSVFRSPNFGKDYGVEISSPPLAGLLSRAIVIVDRFKKVIYTQQVPEIGQEPDYESALKVLKQ